MKKLVVAIALTLCFPIETIAQTCGSRAIVGAAAGWLNVDIPVDSELAGVGRHGLAEAGNGIEGSVHALFPISSTWSVLTEFGAGSPDVLVERDAAGDYVRTQTGDDIALRRLHVGLVRYNVGQYACAYWSVRAALYRFSYRGVTSNAPGGAGTIGIEVPIAKSRSIFFESEWNVTVITPARPPVTPSTGVLANRHRKLGLRYRF
jgi:hypothetical protein